MSNFGHFGSVSQQAPKVDSRGSAPKNLLFLPKITNVVPRFWISQLRAHFEVLLLHKLKTWILPQKCLIQIFGLLKRALVPPFSWHKQFMT